MNWSGSKLPICSTYSRCKYSDTVDFNGHSEFDVPYGSPGVPHSSTSSYPSLLFELEDLENKLDSPSPEENISRREEARIHESIRTLTQAQDSFELQVEESVQQFLRNQYACSGHWKLSEVAKHLSDTRLFAVVLRESSPRQFCLRESFRHLHHTSLHVYETSVVCEQGAVRPTLRSCVVELGLKDHFAVSAPTPNFQVVLESLPSVYVGSAERFASLVVYISQQLAISFKVKGMPLPPWRTAASLLSKWFPEQPVDTTVAAMAGHAHGFDEHKAIPIRHFGLPKACPSVEHSSGPNLELQGLPAAEACCKLHTGTNKSLAEQDGTPRSDMRPIPSAAAPGLIKAHMAVDMGTEDAFLHAFG